MSEHRLPFLDVVIERGTWNGIVLGMYDAGVLISDARQYLERQSFNKTATPKEAGIRDALARLGFLKRGFLGGYARTKKAVPAYAGRATPA